MGSANFTCCGRGDLCAHMTSFEGFIFAPPSLVLTTGLATSAAHLRTFSQLHEIRRQKISRSAQICRHEIMVIVKAGEKVFGLLIGQTFVANAKYVRAKCRYPRPYTKERLSTEKNAQSPLLRLPAEIKVRIYNLGESKPG